MYIIGYYVFTVNFSCIIVCTYETTIILCLSAVRGREPAVVREVSRVRGVGEYGGDDKRIANPKFEYRNPKQI